MNILKNVIRILYKYGDKDNDYLISLGNVWINYSSCDLNLKIKDGKVNVITENGYTYKLGGLTPLEQFSILYSLEQYIVECEKMLNDEFDEDLEF